MRKIWGVLLSFTIIFTFWGITPISAEELNLNDLSLDERLEITDMEITKAREDYFTINGISSELDLSEAQISDLDNLSEEIQMLYIGDILQEILEEEERQIIEESPIQSRSYGGMGTNVGYVYATRTSKFTGFAGHAVIMVSHQGHILEAVGPGKPSRVVAMAVRP